MRPAKVLGVGERAWDNRYDAVEVVCGLRRRGRGGLSQPVVENSTETAGPHTLF